MTAKIIQITILLSCFISTSGNDFSSQSNQSTNTEHKEITSNNMSRYQLEDKLVTHRKIMSQVLSGNRIHEEANNNEQMYEQTETQLATTEVATPMPQATKTAESEQIATELAHQNKGHKEVKVKLHTAGETTTKLDKTHSRKSEVTKHKGEDSELKTLNRTLKQKTFQEVIKMFSGQISDEPTVNEASQLVTEPTEGTSEQKHDKPVKITTPMTVLEKSEIITPDVDFNQNSLSGSRTENNEFKYSKCRLINTTESVTLLCRNLSLTYIPKYKIKFNNIIFEYNNIQTVTRETFSNITEPEHLEGLALNYDNIYNISSGALDRFVNMAYLHISGNPFDYQDLKHLLGAISKLKNLKFLRMEDIPTVTIQDDLFSLMRGTRINFLILKQYQLGSFSLEVLRPFRYLRSLALSRNKITDFKLYKFPHMEKLYIDINLLRTIPNFCFQSGNQSMPYFPRLHLLSLKNNKITDVTRDSFKCLPELLNLQIGINYLSIIPNDFLKNTPNLKTLTMTNQNGRWIRVEPHAFRSRSLRDLRLGFNADALSIFSSLNDTFKSAPNLTVLKIDYISMSHLTNEDFRQLFGPLTKLLYLRCFSCKITHDPKVILANKPELNKLDLGSNLIQTLSPQTFSSNKKLKTLKMRFNKIGNLQESLQLKELLNNLEVFDLSINPFTCTCDLQWLIDWLKASSKNGKNVTLHYPEEYICSNPDDKVSMRLSEVNFSYRECHPWSPGIWVAVIVGPCVIIIGVIALIVYRNRWNIKHYIYLLRKRQNYQLLEGHNYEYDAFVGYEAADSVWVRRNLLPVLEGGEGIKLCIHERDFQAGIFINDNIVSSIDSSKKIILVLTNKFTRSEWCMFELKVAHSKLIENGTDVVVILLEKIDARNMSHSVRLLFQTTTYIEWTEDPVGRDLFWNKLKDAVKK